MNQRNTAPPRRNTNFQPNNRPLTRSVNNPYDRLPNNIVERLVRTRDIDTQGLSNKEALNNYDNFLPNWKQTILTTSLDNLSNLSTDEILFYLVGKSDIDVGYGNIANFSKSKLVLFSKLYLTFNQLKDRQKLVPRENYTIYKNPIVTTKGNLFRVFNAGSIVPPQLIQNNLDFGDDSIFTDEHPFYDYMLELAFYPAFDDPNYYFKLAQNKSLIGDLFLYIFRDPILDNITTDDQQFFMLTRNYPPIDFVPQVQRYNDLKKYNQQELTAIIGGHGLTDEDTPELYLTTPNEIEQIVSVYHDRATNGETAKSIAATIGMYIPGYVNADEYLIDNIASFKYVFERNPNALPPISIDNPASITVENMKWYTDMELLGIFNALTAYTSRNNMLLKFTQLINTPMFFVPLGDRHCRNNETIMSLNDVPTNPELYLIAYGTYNDYYCTDVEDLIDSFGNDFTTNRQGRFRFNNPTDRAIQFSIGDIAELKKLLVYIDDPRVPELITKIDVGLRELANLTQADLQKIRQFESLPTEVQELARNWLMQVFYTGMYMRQWLGPPNPYPILPEDTTRCTNDDPRLHDKVAFETRQIAALERQLGPVNTEFLRRLLTVEYIQHNREGRPDIESVPIDNYLRAVVRGQYCIRMGSTKFIGTAYYYLNLFFPGTVIDNFNIANLGQIM
jgi:hypothetical protein